MKFSRQLTVDADYDQLYVLDSGAALDATGRDDFWTREAFVFLWPGTRSGAEVLKRWPGAAKFARP